MSTQSDELKRTFSRDSEVYDRYRPDYPSELPSYVLGSPETLYDILEVGCGTGIATGLFLPYASHLTAVDPSEEMIGLARQRFAGNRAIEFCCSEFEDTDVEPGRFDLLIAAQSFHWLDLDRAFAKAKTALRAGGRIALFWNYFDFDASPVAIAIRDLILRASPAFGEWPDASSNNYSEYRKQWLGVIRGTEMFTDPIAHSLVRHLRVDSAWFAGWLSTLSWHKLLETEHQASLANELRSLQSQSLSLDLKTLLIVANLRPPS